MVQRITNSKDIYVTLAEATVASVLQDLINLDLKGNILGQLLSRQFQALTIKAVPRDSKGKKGDL